MEDKILVPMTDQEYHEWKNLKKPSYEFIIDLLFKYHKEDIRVAEALGTYDPLGRSGQRVISLQKELREDHKDISIDVRVKEW